LLHASSQFVPLSISFSLPRPSSFPHALSSLSPCVLSLSHSISFQFPSSLSLFSIHPSVQIPRPESATGLNATHLTNPSTQLLSLSLSLSLSSSSSFLFFYPTCFIPRSNGALSVSLNLSLFLPNASPEFIGTFSIGAVPPRNTHYSVRYSAYMIRCNYNQVNNCYGRYGAPCARRGGRGNR